MPEPIETIAVGDLTAIVELDPEPPSPRDCDNLGTMICLHRRYALGDEHDYRADDHSGWGDLEGHIFRDHPGAVILPLFLFDHSGLTMSTTDSLFRAFDSAGWDWGQVGFIFASAEDIRAEYGAKRISRRLRDKVEELLRAEVEEYSMFLAGDAYCFAIETADGEVVSCGGYLGLEHAIAEARSAAEALA